MKMMIIAVLLMLLQVAAPLPQVAAKDDPTMCADAVPAFFESKNTDLETTPSTDFFGLSKKQCLTMCTDNMDMFNNEVQCASLSYNEMTSVCRIYRVQAKPDGQVKMKKMNGVVYYEKFCLPVNAPATCGEARFRREEQMVLVGFARNVSVVSSLEACVAACINEPFECRSAVFFSDVGECITNTGAAMDSPQTFLKEDTDLVTYFDNGCLVKPADKLDDGLVDGNVLSVIDGPAETRTQATVTRLPSTTAAPKQSPEFEHQAGYTQWNEWSKCDRPDGRRIRRRQCQIGDVRQCKFPLLQVQWCSEIVAQKEPAAETTPVLALTETTPLIAQSTVTTKATHLTRITPTTTVQPQAKPEPAVPEPEVPASDIVPENQRGWGSWRTECNKFVTAQPCEDGVEIGFQTRTCEGNPFQCEGPFFRYCTLPC